MSELLDRAGRRRSPATMPGFHAGRGRATRACAHPADPPKVEEIIAVMRAAGDDAQGRRLRGLIVILWRAGLRIQEGLLLAEADLDHNFRVSELAERLNLSAPATNNRRRALWRRGAVARKLVIPPGGGKEFVYRFPEPDEVAA